MWKLDISSKNTRILRCSRTHSCILYLFSDDEGLHESQTQISIQSELFFCTSVKHLDVWRGSLKLNTIFTRWSVLLKLHISLCSRLRVVRTLESDQSFLLISPLPDWWSTKKTAVCVLKRNLLLTSHHINKKTPINQTQVYVMANKRFSGQEDVKLWLYETGWRLSSYFCVFVFN